MPQWLKYNAGTQRWHAKLDEKNDNTLCGLHLKVYPLFPMRVVVGYVPQEDKAELCTDCLTRALGAEEWIPNVPNEGTT